MKKFLVKASAGMLLFATCLFGGCSSGHDSQRTFQREEHITDAHGNWVKDSKGNYRYRKVNVTSCTRKVSAGVSYQIERTKDGLVIGQNNYSRSTERSSENPSTLPSTREMACPLIEGAANSVVGDIIPTRASTRITLAEEKDNKEARKAMKPLSNSWKLLLTKASEPLQ